MAEATPQAPIKQAVKTADQIRLEKCKAVIEQSFEIDKKYMFQLAVENLERDMPVVEIINDRAARSLPHKKFKPSQNIVYTSQIVWPKGLKDPWSNKERNAGRYIIRYYDGCTTLFMDGQPQDRETIEQLRKQTKERRFLDGKFGCHGDEVMLLSYLYMCSWNQDSPFKTPSSSTIFVPVDRTRIATVESQRLDQTEKALQLAKEASEEKMMIHAAYLRIPMTDYDSDNPLTPNEIRALYRKEALGNAEVFINTYGDKTIEIKHYIRKALETGLIDTKFNPNMAVWATSKKPICDINGIKTLEAIATKIFEHSQLAEGEEFVIQLQALFK